MSTHIDTTLPTLLTTDQLQEMGIAEKQTLINWRSKRQGPPFIKLGKKVAYPKDKLLKWLDSRTITPAAI